MGCKVFENLYMVQHQGFVVFLFRGCTKQQFACGTEAGFPDLPLSLLVKGVAGVVYAEWIILGKGRKSR